MINCDMINCERPRSKQKPGNEEKVTLLLSENLPECNLSRISRLVSGFSIPKSLQKLLFKEDSVEVWVNPEKHGIPCVWQVCGHTRCLAEIFLRCVLQLSSLWSFLDF